MIIGIPNGMYTNMSNLMYKTFFNNLGMKVVFSGKTTNSIKENGIKLSSDEACLASKIFIGHINYLVEEFNKGKIDYIFIPRLCTYKKNETECVRFYAMYDICNNIFNANFVALNLDYANKSDEVIAYINLGKSLGCSKIKSFLAYINAKKTCVNQYKENLKYNLKTSNNKNKKILIVSHPYIYDDELLGKPICKYLKSQNFDLIFADKENINKDLYKEVSKTLFWKQSKTIMNGFVKQNDNVNGIIYMSVFSCGTDSLTTDIMQRRKKNVPSINLIIDEQNEFEGYKTRLESFIDIIDMNR